MNSENKMAKLKPRHFSFRIKNRKIDGMAWTEYYKHKRNAKHDEHDKFFLKEFRKQLKRSEVKVIVTHVPSRIKKEFIVETVNRQELMNNVRDYVKEVRKFLIIPTRDQREYGGARYEVVGGVMVDKALINGLGKKLTINNPLTTKKPITKYKNYLGIELEFNTLPNTSTEMIGAALKGAGLARYVHVGVDGSCGYEVRVLLEEQGFEEPLQKIMDLLVAMGFKAEHNCGTHIHLDMRNRDVKQVYKNLVLSQSFLRKFLTRERKKNKYCKINRHADFDHQLMNQEQGGERYYGINVLSYKEHRTLEIRMHQGTLDFNVLSPYIKLLSKLVNYKGELTKPVNTLKQAKAQYDIETDLSRKLAERIGTLFGRIFTTQGAVNV